MYVPVMKNRTVEMNVLTQLASLGVFNNTKKVFPLIELIQEKIRTNTNTLYMDFLIKLLKENSDMSVMIDFYKSTYLGTYIYAIAHRWNKHLKSHRTFQSSLLRLM